MQGFFSLWFSHNLCHFQDIATYLHINFIYVCSIYNYTHTHELFVYMWMQVLIVCSKLINMVWEAASHSLQATCQVQLYNDYLVDTHHQSLMHVESL